jgi:hypothetical protein
MLCLARLTSWEKTNSPIGDSNKRASYIKLCKNTPEKGQVLCQDCLLRPEGGKYQTRMIHGTLMEPPCADSHIYGSQWYWERVAKHGDPQDTEWLQAAQEAQAAGEERCKKAGYSPWQVQRPNAWRLEEMKKKAAAKAKEAAEVRLSQVKEKKGTLLEKFAPIKVVYEESDKAPEKLPTDTCKIWRDTVGEMNVWITENGLVFDEDTTGHPGELIGRCVKGTACEFIGLDES